MSDDHEASTTFKEHRRRDFTGERAGRLIGAIPILEGSSIRAAVDRMTVADRERIAAALREFSAAVVKAEEEALLVETDV